jgi:hypothetical protein
MSLISYVRKMPINWILVIPVMLGVIWICCIVLLNHYVTQRDNAKKLADSDKCIAQTIPHNPQQYERDFQTYWLVICPTGTRPSNIVQ